VKALGFLSFLPGARQSKAVAVLPVLVKNDYNIDQILNIISLSPDHRPSQKDLLLAHSPKNSSVNYQEKE